MKLKTLKDLEFKWVLTDKDNYSYQEVVDRDELRQEAIKWIKMIDRNKMSKADANSLWMRFYNITEEDLK